MATKTVTLTGNVADAIGIDFLSSSTKVWVEYNANKVVTDGSDPIRLGSATVVVAADGTFTLPNVVAETSLAENLQSTVKVNWRNNAGPNKTRQEASFGPYDLSDEAEDATLDIRDLEAVQALPATVVSAAVTQIQALIDQFEELAGIPDTDAELKYLMEHGDQSAPFITDLTADAAEAEFDTLVGNIPTYIFHGSDAAYARPDYPGPAIWVGTVHPANVLGRDSVQIVVEIPVEPSVAWLGKFDPSSILVSDGSAVASWENTGTGADAEQSSGTQRPVKASIEGRAVITFDGNNDRLQVDWGGSIYPATYIFPFYPTELPTGASLDYLLDTPPVISGTNRHRIYLGSDGLHVGAPSGNLVVVAPPPAINEWHIVSWVVNGNNSVFRLDGVDYSFNTGNAGSLNAFFGGGTSGTQGFNGSLGPIRVAGSALALSTVQSVERWLAYNFGVDLP